MPAHNGYCMAYVYIVKPSWPSGPHLNVETVIFESWISIM